MNVWLKTLLSLAAVWLLAFGAVHWLHASKPTAASITDYLKHTNLASRSPGERARILQRAADQLNELSFDERQRLQRSGDTHRFFDALTPAEQSRFLDATLPNDFKQLMEVFNQMEPAKRKEFVNHALDDMKKHEGEAPLFQRVDEILQTGFRRAAFDCHKYRNGMRCLFPRRCSRRESSCRSEGTGFV